MFLLIVDYSDLNSGRIVRRDRLQGVDVGFAVEPDLPDDSGMQVDAQPSLANLEIQFDPNLGFPGFDPNYR